MARLEPWVVLEPSRQRPPANSQLSYIQELLKNLAILSLAAATSEVSRLCLSPVYGSIAKPYNPTWEYCLIYLVWISFANFREQTLTYLAKATPIFGCAIPGITFYLHRFSGRLGPQWGPLLMALVTTLPLIYLSLLTTLNNLAQNRKISPDHGGHLSILTVIFLWGILFALRWIANLVFSIMIDAGSSRYLIQAAIALCYPVLDRSRLMLVTLPLIYFALSNEHMPGQMGIDMLNHSLQPHGYKVIARQESLTGYLSVTDNVKDGFRVMRCDHSLLGGEWINRPAGYASLLNEPVYAIFVMLEAVRLIVPEKERLQSLPKPETLRKALFIGLGIGTSQAALVAHGVHTTTIEIDPVVRDFATRYFELPANHTSIVADALFATKSMHDEQRTYDFIVHDVFTGGAEPIELFTFEFVSDLSRLLKDDGSIAINYAGDLLLPSTASVVKTIMSVFARCRLFREMARQSTTGPSDFTNMVLFCRKLREPFGFRDPVEADYLGSQARKEHLLPQHEIDANIFDNGEVIKRSTTWRYETSQKKSALGHWHVMRSVLPDAVWEHW